MDGHGHGCAVRVLFGTVQMARSNHCCCFFFIFFCWNIEMPSDSRMVKLHCGYGLSNGQCIS